MSLNVSRRTGKPGNKFKMITPEGSVVVEGKADFVNRLLEDFLTLDSFRDLVREGCRGMSVEQIEQRFRDCFPEVEL